MSTCPSKNWCFWTVVLEKTGESLGLQGDPTSPFWRKSALGFLWKEWCWSWNSSTLATSCEELTHWKRVWCWEGLGAGGEEDDGGWDGWMASRTRWTWVWVNSGRWWWTGRPGVLRFMGSQKSRTRLSDWTELNWGFSVHGIFQARVLEWGAVVFSGNILNFIKCQVRQWSLLLYICHSAMTSREIINPKWYW